MWIVVIRKRSVLFAAPLAVALLVSTALAASGPSSDSVTHLASARCGGAAATIVGTPRDDRLRGSGAADVIAGLGGDDTISGGAGGNDVVCGGGGNDRMVTGGGSDRIFGGAGRDKLVSKGGPDLLYGGGGNDRLDGGGGVDGCRGGGGKNVIRNCEGVTPPSGGGSPPRGAPADSPPVAAGDSPTVAEDAPATAIDVLANDTDVDGGPKSVASKSDGANGTVVITGGGSGLTYQPAANYCGGDSFTYTLNGGSSATVSITVSCVDDPPGAVDDSESLAEDAPATAIDVLANDTDVDGGPKSVASKSDGANGTVVITGGGSGLTYQPAANYCGGDSFTYTLNGGSSATVSITVSCVDDPPGAVDDSESLAEDAPATAIDVLANDTDVDGGPKSVASKSDGANGTVVITGGGSGLTYQPAANYCGGDSFTYTLNGGSSATVSITVSCANDPPTAIQLSPSSVEENKAAGTTVGTFSTTDPDQGDTFTYLLVEGTGDTGNAQFTISGNSLKTAASFNFEAKSSYSIRIRSTDAGGARVAEVITITVVNVNETATDIQLSSSSVEENKAVGTTVGTLSTTDPDAGETFTYTLVSGTGSTDNAQFTISGSSLKSAASFNFEAKSSYSIRIRSTDKGSAFVEEQFTVTVTNLNEAPTDIQLSNNSIEENQPATSNVGSFSTTDQDAGEAFTYTLVSGTGSTDNAQFTISGSSLKTAASFNFEAKSSYSIRVRSTDKGSAFFEKQFTITVVDVNDTPVGGPDSYAGAVGNTTGTLGIAAPPSPSVVLTGMGGNLLLANDTDEDGDTLSAKVETVATTGGGTVEVRADGSFIYTPGVGDEGQNDSFTYRLRDGKAASDVTVTIAIEKTLIWYVDASALAGGDGRSSSPLKTPAGINGAGGAGDSDNADDYIFLYGSSTYAGGLPLESGQRLIGSPQGLSVPGHANLVSPSGGSNPAVTNAAGDGIGLASASQVLRVDATGSSGAGIRGVGVPTSSVGPSTTISGNTGGAVVLSGAAIGDIVIDSTIEGSGVVVSVANRTAGTVRLSGAITSANGGVSVSGNAEGHVSFLGPLHLTRASGDVFSATGGGFVKATNADNLLTAGTGAAIRIVGTTIDSGGFNVKTVNSVGAASGIVLENTGSASAFNVTGTGGAGSGGTIQSSTGPGIQLSNASSINLASIKVAGGGDDGIRGNAVNNLTLTNASDITGNGNAAGESGLDFTGLTGTVSLTGATVSGSADRNVSIVNSSGTLDAIFSGGLYSSTNNSAFGSDAIFFEATGTGSFGLKVEKASFTNNRGDHVQVTTDGANTATENVTITGNTMSNTIGQPGGGITLNPGGNATMEASVTNNDIQGARIEGITVDTPGSLLSPQPAQVDVAISGNTIGDPAVSKSGSSSGNAMGIRSNGSATVRALVTGNSLHEYTNAFGLELVQNDGIGSLQATVRSNTISDPDAIALSGLRAVIGSETGDTGTSCLDIGGAAALKNNLTGSATAGNPDIRLAMNGEATLQLPGYGGGANDDVAVETYLAGRNTTSAVPPVNASQFDASSKFAPAASCPTP